MGVLRAIEKLDEAVMDANPENEYSHDDMMEVVEKLDELMPTLETFYHRLLELTGGV